MSILAGGSYSLNPNTGEYDLVEQAQDQAEAPAAPVAASESAAPAKRAAKITTEE